MELERMFALIEVESQEKSRTERARPRWLHAKAIDRIDTNQARPEQENYEPDA